MFEADFRLLSRARRLAETGVTNEAPAGAGTPHVIVTGEARVVRERRMLTLVEVARVTGLPPSTLIRIESGKRRIPASPAGMRYARWLLDRTYRS